MANKFRNGYNKHAGIDIAQEKGSDSISDSAEKDLNNNSASEEKNITSKPPRVSVRTSPAPAKEASVTKTFRMSSSLYDELSDYINMGKLKKKKISYSNVLEAALRDYMQKNPH